MKRDRIDPRRPERTAVGFAVSLIVHALMAYFLFSLATSSFESTSPESIAGAAIVSISREVVRPQRRVRPKPQVVVPRPRRVIAKAELPVPHARVVPHRRPSARRGSAVPHPRVLHHLAHFKRRAPPNPTPAPVAYAVPNPAPRRAVLAVKPAQIPAVAPTLVPVTIAAATSVRTPPTAAPTPPPHETPRPHETPQPRPTPQPVPTVEPTLAPPTTAPPTVAPPTVAPAVIPQTVGIPTPAPQPAPTVRAAPTEGPKALQSPGPRPLAAVKGPAIARPIQPLPATPRPSAGRVKRSKLLRRLLGLIPKTAPAVSPAPNERYSFLNVKETPPPEPTPPPDVLAATKFLFVENVASQRWRQSYLGVSPEERYVKMYVTSVTRIGFINWCHGWVLRSPIAGSSKWIVEPNESLICSGHLEPFAPPSPQAASSPQPP